MALAQQGGLMSKTLEMITSAWGSSRTSELAPKSLEAIYSRIFG